MLVNLWKLPWRQVRRSLTQSRPSKWWQLDPCQHFLCRTPRGVWTCVHMFIIHSQPSKSVLWHPQQRFKVKWPLCQVAHIYCVTGEECLNVFKSSCGKFLLPLPQFQPNLILSSERLYRKHPPSPNSSPFSHPRRLDACVRAGRLFCVHFHLILCIYVQVCVAIVCQCSSRGFKVNYSCEIWIHANGSLPSLGTDPGYLWQRRLQEASFHPSSSSSSSARFSQAPALQPCYLASRIVSTIAVPGWVAAHCRVAGYPIIHSQGHKGREGGREKVGRQKEGSIPPSSSDGKFRRQHPAGGEE